MKVEGTFLLAKFMRPPLWKGVGWRGGVLGEGAEFGAVEGLLVFEHAKAGSAELFLNSAAFDLKETNRRVIR